MNKDTKRKNNQKKKNETENISTEERKKDKTTKKRQINRRTKKMIPEPRLFLSEVRQKPPHKYSLFLFDGETSHPKKT